jgi:hypothetical protein
MSPETQAKQLSTARKTRIVERKAKVKEWGVGKFLTSLTTRNEMSWWMRRE